MKPSAIVLIVFCVCLFTNNVSAQNVMDSSVYDETMWTMKKRKLVLDYLDLTEAEKASFWPLYENYSQAIRFIETETLQIISVCNDPGSNLDQTDLERYSKKRLQNDLLLDRVRIQYYRKFSKALTPVRASQFMQLDENLRMMLRMEVQQNSQSAGEAQASIR
jgi:Spy/CpxP family protein refolding chaperone